MIKRVLRGRLAALATGVLMLGAAGSANATLLGDTVSCSVSGTGFGACSAPTAVVVNPGEEFTVSISGVTSWAVDLTSNTITVRGNRDGFIGTSASVVLTLSDLNWVGMPNGAISGVTNLQTNLVATTFGLSNISTTANSVSIELGQAPGTTGFPRSWGDDGFASFELVTSHELPEPASIALMGMGLAGLGLAKRRARRES